MGATAERTCTRQADGKKDKLSRALFFGSLSFSRSCPADEVFPVRLPDLAENSRGWLFIPDSRVDHEKRRALLAFQYAMRLDPLVILDSTDVGDLLFNHFAAIGTQRWRDAAAMDNADFPILLHVENYRMPMDQCAISVHAEGFAIDFNRFFMASLITVIAERPCPRSLKRLETLCRGLPVSSRSQQ